MFACDAVRRTVYVCDSVGNTMDSFSFEAKGGHGNTSYNITVIGALGIHVYYFYHAYRIEGIELRNDLLPMMIVI